MKNKLREILEELITKDDKNRSKLDYDVGKTLDKAEEKIRKLRITEL